MTIAYTVTAEFDDLSVATEYVQWLQHGHLADVIAGGATQASLSRLEASSEKPLRFEARYLFPSMAAFTRYETQFAPRLRAEGAAKFPPARGVRMTRALAEVLSALVGPA